MARWRRTTEKVQVSRCHFWLCIVPGLGGRLAAAAAGRLVRMHFLMTALQATLPAIHLSCWVAHRHGLQAGQAVPVQLLYVLMKRRAVLTSLCACKSSILLP